MNKVYSKKELESRAQEVFDQYPSEDKVYAREDGNVFFNENLAELDKGKLKVYLFEKSDFVKTDKVIEDIDVDAEIITTDIKIGEATGKTMEAILANADGSISALEVVNPIVEVPTVVEAPVVETPVVEVPVVGAPKVDKTLGKSGKNPENRNSNTKK